MENLAKTDNSFHLKAKTDINIKYDSSLEANKYREKKDFT